MIHCPYDDNREVPPSLQGPVVTCTSGPRAVGSLFASIITYKCVCLQISRSCNVATNIVVICFCFVLEPVGLHLAVL
jgi:hypothetical protein